MDRLTEKCNGRNVIRCEKVSCASRDICAATTCCVVEQTALDKLAAYEATGLEPEEIRAIFQKTLGFTICHECKSVLRIEKTDVFYKNVRGKTASCFTCAACGHEQVFLQKDLMSHKRALEESVQG